MPAPSHSVYMDLPDGYRVIFQRADEAAFFDTTEVWSRAGQAMELERTELLNGSAAAETFSDAPLESRPVPVARESAISIRRRSSSRDGRRSCSPPVHAASASTSPRSRRDRPAPLEPASTMPITDGPPSTPPRPLVRVKVPVDTPPLPSRTPRVECDATIKAEPMDLDLPPLPTGTNLLVPAASPASSPAKPSPSPSPSIVAPPPRAPLVTLTDEEGAADMDDLSDDEDTTPVAPLLEQRPAPRSSASSRTSSRSPPLSPPLSPTPPSPHSPPRLSTSPRSRSPPRSPTSPRPTPAATSAAAAVTARIVALVPAHRRAHILAYLGVETPTGAEPGTQLFGAFVYSRIENLLTDPDLLDDFIEQIRADGPHDGGVLAEAMSEAGDTIDYRKLLARLRHPARGRATSSLAAEAEDLAQIVLFLACVADNIEEALGCGEVLIPRDAAKVEVISALTHTSHASLLKRARQWYRAAVYDDVDYPSWLGDDGANDPLWERFLVYAKSLGDAYRALQSALRPSCDNPHGDPLGDRASIPAGIFDNFSRAIPVLGLRVPAMREKMVDATLQMIDATPFASLKIVAEVALVAAVSPAHLKYVIPRRGKGSQAVFLNMCAKSRTPAAKQLIDVLTDLKRPVPFAFARVPLQFETDGRDSCGARAAKHADKVDGRIKLHSRSHPPPVVECERLKACVLLEPLKNALGAIPAEEGIPRWDELREHLDLLCRPPAAE
ncbi:hypothetical protein H9P43_007636 [Blastocladiella emersonii ATCC 22665]|nr:hypothetical protein H9P43_007636 [Blastocladiella emersonii ATCC 22665]